uniref:Uncharacterized protein n=1 Tax=Lepeophtheirus salmonis TaxID=72036 RepID=A0A0K2TYA5_LEPSM
MIKQNTRRGSKFSCAEAQRKTQLINLIECLIFFFF